MAWRDAEWHGQLLDYCDCRIPAPAFDIADIGAVDTGAVGVVFLAPAFGLAQAANVLTKAHTYIHAELKTRLSPINLQTISDIGVDFTVNGRLVSLMIDIVPLMLLPGIGATAVELPLRRLA